MSDNSLENMLNQLRASLSELTTSDIDQLQQIGSDSAMDLLIHVLQAPAASIRSHAAIALGELGDSRAIVPLIHLYQREFALKTEQSINVCIWTKRALGSLYVPTDGSWLEWIDIDTVITALNEDTGGQGIDRILELLAHNPFDTQHILVVWGLALKGDPRALPELHRILAAYPEGAAVTDPLWAQSFLHHLYHLATQLAHDPPLPQAHLPKRLPFSQHYTEFFVAHPTMAFEDFCDRAAAALAIQNASVMYEEESMWFSELYHEFKIYLTQPYDLDEYGHPTSDRTSTAPRTVALQIEAPLSLERPPGNLHPHIDDAVQRIASAALTELHHQTTHIPLVPAPYTPPLIFYP